MLISYIMKKKLLAIILCLCSFLLCGCGVPPQYTIAQKSDGTVEQLVYIPFSGAELQNLGVHLSTIAEISNSIKQVFDNYFNNIFTNYMTRLRTDPYFNAEQQLYILNGCPAANDIEGEGDFSGIEYNFYFDSALHYYYFNRGMYYEELVEELNKDESITQEGLFTNRITNTSKTVYGVNTQFDQNKTFAQYIVAQCEEALRDKTNLTEEKIQSVLPKTFVYRYGTSSKRLHSDADLVRYIDGVYYHEWNITLEDSAREISTWQITVNRNVWYAVILGSAILLALVLILVCYIKNKKSKVQIKVEKPN